MRIAVADDEELFQRRIGDFLKKYLGEKNVGYELEYFNSGKQIVEIGPDIRFYDVFFLDISMKDINGIETAKTIREFSNEAFIVFVTAYLDYSIEGYKVNAIRYVLKENENFEDSLVECMETIMKRMVGRKPLKRFKFNEGEEEIAIENILYIDSRLHKLEFHLVDREKMVFTMYQTLNTIERELAGYATFIRIHQSFLVNLRYIKTVNHYMVVLVNDEEINVPKARYGEVKKAFIKYKREV